MEVLNPGLNTVDRSSSSVPQAYNNVAANINKMRGPLNHAQYETNFLSPSQGRSHEGAGNDKQVKIVQGNQFQNLVQSISKNQKPSYPASQQGVQLEKPDMFSPSGFSRDHPDYLPFLANGLAAGNKGSFFSDLIGGKSGQSLPSTTEPGSAFSNLVGSADMVNFPAAFEQKTISFPERRSDSGSARQSTSGFHGGGMVQVSGPGAGQAMAAPMKNYAAMGIHLAPRVDMTAPGLSSMNMPTVQAQGMNIGLPKPIFAAQGQNFAPPKPIMVAPATNMNEPGINFVSTSMNFAAPQPKPSNGSPYADADSGQAPLLKLNAMHPIHAAVTAADGQWDARTHRHQQQLQQPVINPQANYANIYTYR